MKQAKQPITPNSQIKGMLRILWLRSRERAAALKRDNYSCCKCHVKQSKKKGFEQKVEVHHMDGIDYWEELINMIREKLLIDPSKLQTLCPDCHGEHTTRKHTL